MADPNIQTLIYPMSIGPGIIKTYQTDVNKRTGASITYDITNIGQKTPILQSDPAVIDGNPTYIQTLVDSYTSTYSNLSETDKNFLLNKLGPQADNQRAAFVNKNYTATQRQQLFAGMPRVKNTAAPAAPSLPAATPFSQAVQNPITNVEIGGTTSADFSNEIMIYPKNLSKSTQDYLQITAIEYRARTIGTTGNNFDFRKLAKGFNPRNELVTRGTCYLPIQPIILDQNIVNWGPENMDAFSALFAQASYAISNNPGQALKGFQDFTGALGALGGGDNVKNALRLYLAGRAVSNQSFFTRITGAIVNPNLELLFNGPSLRTFNYSFRLSPRNTDEAKSVKTIIRFFKEMSAVRTATNAIFLRSPNVFKIKYTKGGSEGDHKSLHRIKTCALTSMTVNYTPDNSYMTFTDAEATMTSYDMALTFQELEPVYDKDYQRLADKSEIGF